MLQQKQSLKMCKNKWTCLHRFSNHIRYCGDSKKPPKTKDNSEKVNPNRPHINSKLSSLLMAQNLAKSKAATVDVESSLHKAEHARINN